MASIAPTELFGGVRGSVTGVHGAEISRFTASELTNVAVEYLLEVIASRPQGRQLACGVTAATRILSHAEWLQERDEASITLTMRGVPVDRIPAEQLRALTARAESLRGAQESEASDEPETE
jgi:hypothetical protein